MRCIAHRGASGHLPEHTLEAKAYARALGADCLDQDVVLSKDGVPVVMRDIHIDTITDVAKRFPERKRADGRYYALDFTVSALAEIRRLQGELGWRGNLVMLISGRATEADGVNHDELCTAAGIRELATLVNGIGPPTGRIVTWPGDGKEPQFTDLVPLAHAGGLVVHPYAVRRDDLPKHCPSTDALHAALFAGAKVGGVFTDFAAPTIAWIRHASSAPSQEH